VKILVENPLEEKKLVWKCNKCNKETAKLQICWGIDEGQKVDIIDYFCPFCGHDELTFRGTKKEKDAWWDNEWKMI
jgi:Zn finger protein HypA/HybF involved in hydrogenase expression